MVEKAQNMDLELLPEGYLITYEQLNTLLAFEHEWMRYGMWMRSLMLSTIYDLPNKEAAADQVFLVLEDMHDTFKVFYGPNISQQFLNYMVKFTSSLWQLVEALVEGDEERVDAATVAAYQDADRLIELLARINVYWDESQWRRLFYQFVRLYIDETLSTLRGEHEQEVAIYTELEEETRLMGSYMARGIVARSL